MPIFVREGFLEKAYTKTEVDDMLRGVYEGYGGSGFLILASVDELRKSISGKTRKNTLVSLNLSGHYTKDFSVTSDNQGAFKFSLEDAIPNGNIISVFAHDENMNIYSLIRIKVGQVQQWGEVQQPTASIKHIDMSIPPDDVPERAIIEGIGEPDAVVQITTPQGISVATTNDRGEYSLEFFQKLNENDTFKLESINKMGKKSLPLQIQVPAVSNNLIHKYTPSTQMEYEYEHILLTSKDRSLDDIQNSWKKENFNRNVYNLNIHEVIPNQDKLANVESVKVCVLQGGALTVGYAGQRGSIKCFEYQVNEQVAKMTFVIPQSGAIFEFGGNRSNNKPGASAYEGYGAYLVNVQTDALNYNGNYLTKYDDEKQYGFSYHPTTTTVTRMRAYLIGENYWPYLSVEKKAGNSLNPNEATDEQIQSAKLFLNHPQWDSIIDNYIQPMPPQQMPYAGERLYAKHAVFVIYKYRKLPIK